MRCPWKVWREVKRLEMLARTGMCSRAQAIFSRPAGASLGSLTLLKSGLAGRGWAISAYAMVLGRYV